MRHSESSKFLLTGIMVFKQAFGFRDSWWEALYVGILHLGFKVLAVNDQGFLITRLHCRSEASLDLSARIILGKLCFRLFK